MGEYISKYANGTAVDNALDAGLAASAEVVDARGGFESLSARLAALEYEDITITSFTASPSTAELGSSTNVSLAWTINKSPTYQDIDGTSVQGNSKQYSGITATHTFTLNATDGETTATKQATVTFVNQIYYGVASDLSNVTALSKVLSDKKTRTITVDAGTGKYIIYAIPARLGSVAFYVSGFEGGFEAPVTQMLTNASGYQEAYKIYRSANAGLGSTTIEVKEG